MADWQTKRLLIWGKTYPELSEKYRETVCTAGVDEAGHPIRLYPLPIRYMQAHQKFKLYDWVTVSIRKAHADSRPESYSPDRDRMTVSGAIPPDRHEWAERRKVLFRDASWQFGSMTELKDAERASGRSLGWISPGEICGTALEESTVAEKSLFDAKFARLARQQSFLDTQAAKTLRFRTQKVFLMWRCPDACTECSKRPHRMQALDWGLMELGFREGWAAAQSKLEDITNPTTHDFRLFLGNMKARRQIFSVVGLWYPKRRMQRSLL